MSTKPKEKAKQLFARLSHQEINNIQTLSRSGLSLKQISTHLKIPKTTIYHHAKKYCKKMTYLNQAALSEKELGYLVGMFVGDGTHIIKTGRGTYITKFSLDKRRDDDVATHVCGLFAKGDKRVAQRIERNSITLRVFSKEFVNFLAKHVERIEQSNTHRKKKLLIDYEKWSEAFKLGFVGGLIDSDGHVYFDTKRGKRFGALIRTANGALRDQIISVLSNLGVATTTYKGKYHEKSYSFLPQYVIYIPTKELNEMPEMLSIKLRRCVLAK